MNTYLYLYENSVLFEVVVAAYLMHTAGNVYILTDSDKAVTTYEGFSINPTQAFASVAPDDVDLFILTGGDYQNIQKPEPLHQLLLQLHARKKTIAAICSGQTLLQELDILQGTSPSPNPVTTHNHLILSDGNTYIDFAIEIGKHFHIYQNKDDLDETINYFKFFKV